jgi:hypothetical protein
MSSALCNGWTVGRSLLRCCLVQLSEGGSLIATHKKGRLQFAGAPMPSLGLVVSGGIEGTKDDWPILAFPLSGCF